MQSFVDYPVAQEMIPSFRDMATRGLTGHIRTGANTLLMELEFVRNMDYSPLSGMQILPTAAEREVLSLYWKGNGRGRPPTFET